MIKLRHVTIDELVNFVFIYIYISEGTTGEKKILLKYLEV